MSSDLRRKVAFLILFVRSKSYQITVSCYLSKHKEKSGFPNQLLICRYYFVDFASIEVGQEKTQAFQTTPRKLSITFF